MDSFLENNKIEAIERLVKRVLSEKYELEYGAHWQECNSIVDLFDVECTRKFELFSVLLELQYSAMREIEFERGFLSKFAECKEDGAIEAYETVIGWIDDKMREV